MLLLDTISFLTVFPVSKKGKVGYKMFCVFPVVGLVIGLLCYGFVKVVESFFSFQITVLFSLVFYIVVADYLHLDGFVDTVDATFSSLNKSPVEVLKDPHIGSVGVVYLILLLLVKYMFLLELDENIFVLMTTLGRWSMAISGFFGEKLYSGGLGEKFIYKNKKVLILSCVPLFVLLFFVSEKIFLFVLIGIIFVISTLITKFFNFKLGGINGDIMGFVSEVSEVVVLIFCYFCKIFQ